MASRVAVFGAGLSGLACGIELKRKGFDVTIYDASDRAGGRVKTDRLDGFLLDHGFQVFLPSYELGSHFLNYSKLELKSFSPGALIHDTKKFNLISDPFRDPSHLLTTLLSPMATLKDKVLTLRLIFQSRISYKEISRGGDAQSYLKSLGFSQKYINGFFVPFFSGVFLNRELDVPENFFKYLFGRFSQGRASLPRKGMEQLPLQMVDEIGRDRIRLKSNNEIRDVLGSGEFDYVVQAFDGNRSPENYREVSTHYFKTRSEKWAKKTLFLAGASAKSVNHVACLTAVNPEYAPEGWHLYSVNALGKPVDDLSDDLSTLFGKKEFESWEHLKTYYIKEALPSKPFYGELPLRDEYGIFHCGDHRESPSIQGALYSGLRVAQEIAKF